MDGEGSEDPTELKEGPMELAAGSQGEGEGRGKVKVGGRFPVEKRRAYWQARHLWVTCHM